MWKKIVSLSALALFSLSLCAQEALNFCYNEAGSYPWQAPDRPGLSSRIALLVGVQLGQPVTLTALPWQRCVNELQKGHFHGVLGASYKAERLVFGQYPLDDKGRLDHRKRMFSEAYVLVRPKGSQVSWDGKAVQPPGATIAANHQFSVVDLLRALGTKVDDGTRGTELTLRKVLLKRADAAVVQLNGAKFEFEKHPEFADTLEIQPLPVDEKDYYLVLGHALGPTLSKRIWDAVERVRESKSYAAQQKAFFSGQ